MNKFMNNKYRQPLDLSVERDDIANLRASSQLEIHSGLKNMATNNYN